MSMLTMAVRASRLARLRAPLSGARLGLGFTSYDRLLTAAPFRTKALTACCISATGDVLVQLLSRHDASPSVFDACRTLRQVVWSGCSSPFVHLEYNLLAVLPPLGPLPASVTGVIVSQVVFSPAFHVVYFAWISSAQSGFTRPVAQVKSDVCRKLWPAMQASFLVWPIVTGLNIVFVPLQYRVLFVNLAGMGYGMLMSWMANEPPLVDQRSRDAVEST